MATLPIPGLLAEFKILGLQAMDFGAQLSHFRARVLHWGVQLREEMTGKTDLCQLAVHDHLGLTKIAPKGKGLVLLQPEQKNQKERDGQRFTSSRPGVLGRSRGSSRFAPSLIDWYRSCIVNVKQEIVAWLSVG